MEESTVESIKEEIILYSVGCPKCRVLEVKLDQKNISYTIETNEEIMKSKKVMSVPMLEVSNVMMDFYKANTWINGQ